MPRKFRDLLEDMGGGTGAGAVGGASGTMSADVQGPRMPVGGVSYGKKKTPKVSRRRTPGLISGVLPTVQFPEQEPAH